MCRRSSPSTACAIGLLGGSVLLRRRRGRRVGADSASVVSTVVAAVVAGAVAGGRRRRRRRPVVVTATTASLVTGVVESVPPAPSSSSPSRATSSHTAAADDGQGGDGDADPAHHVAAMGNPATVLAGELAGAVGGDGAGRRAPRSARSLSARAPRSARSPSGKRLGQVANRGTTASTSSAKGSSPRSSSPRRLGITSPGSDGRHRRRFVLRSDPLGSGGSPDVAARPTCGSSEGSSGDGGSGGSVGLTAVELSRRSYRIGRRAAPPATRRPADIGDRLPLERAGSDASTPNDAPGDDDAEVVPQESRGIDGRVERCLDALHERAQRQDAATRCRAIAASPSRRRR